jgi:hypothetical protein
MTNPTNYLPKTGTSTLEKGVLALAKNIDEQFWKN